MVRHEFLLPERGSRGNVISRSSPFAWLIGLRSSFVSIGQRLSDKKIVSAVQVVRDVGLLAHVSLSISDVELLFASFM